MAPITLKKYLRKEGRPIIEGMLAINSEPIGILDADGQLLMGSALNGTDAGVNVPLIVDGQVTGWVAGLASSRWKEDVAALLAHLLEQESAKKALAGEVLDKYRELHLLYRLSEELAATLRPQAIGETALREICPLLQANGGVAILQKESTGELEIVANCDCDCEINLGGKKQPGFLSKVLQTGTAQIINDWDASKFFIGLDKTTTSILCAPLKTEKHIFGAIVLFRDASRPFTAGDIKLLNAVAMQASPAIEIANLHRMELENARIERDLQTARQVQSGLLPRRMPNVAGWQVAAHWQPARGVSGDLYDFIRFSDGKLGLIVADVTDKGVPAALVMANTRSILRGVATSIGKKGSESPARLLTRVNHVLYEDMPMNMFVTCLLVILDPHTGEIRFSNAGHNLPILRSGNDAIELRATGLPLGIFPNPVYEDKEAVLAPGDSLLMFSDGLVEAHSPQGEMFGFPRLRQMMHPVPGQSHLEGDELLHQLMAELAAFTGPDWEQEDDVTLLTVYRL